MISSIKKVLLICCILTAVLQIKASTPAANIPKGIYVASEWQKPIADYVLKSPDVDGVFLRLFWNAIQTSKKSCDWSFVDSELDRINKAGKKVSIGIMAGTRCPEWIFTEGAVPYLTFTELPGEGSRDGAVTAKCPVVWDKKFLDIYNDFITQFANHLKSKPEWYRMLTVVKIAGINRATIELRLPAQRELENKKGVKSTDAYALWKSVDYRPQKVKDAFLSIMESYSKNFPDKVLSMAYIPERGFPFINEKGEEVQKSAANDLTPELIKMGFDTYGKKFAIQFNALNTKPDARPFLYVQQYAKKGFVTGYQINQSDLAKPDCLDKSQNKPCDEKMFQLVMDNGIKDGVAFIEIFSLDVLAYPKAIAYAHTKLNDFKLK